MEPEIATRPPKKPRSEAQKKATENALNILKARREAKKEEHIRAERSGVAHSHSERNLTEKPERQEKPVAHSHSERNMTDYVTKKDLEAYMAGMQTKKHVQAKKAVARSRQTQSDASLSESDSESEQEVVTKKSKPRPQPAVTKEPVKLSGYELLDAVFFSHR